VTGCAVTIGSAGCVAMLGAGVDIIVGVGNTVVGMTVGVATGLLHATKNPNIPTKIVMCFITTP
jgi:hypothetical protein